MSEQTAIQIAATHRPVGNRVGEVHVALHHDWLAMVRCVMPSNRVDQRAVAHEPVVVHAAAPMKGFVIQIIEGRKHHQQKTGICRPLVTCYQRRRQGEQHENQECMRGKSTIRHSLLLP